MKNILFLKIDMDRKKKNSSQITLESRCSKSFVRKSYSALGLAPLALKPRLLHSKLIALLANSIKSNKPVIRSFWGYFVDYKAGGKKLSIIIFVGR